MTNNSDTRCYPEKQRHDGEISSKVSSDMSRKLFRSTSIVSLMTMISRILGFVRDVVLAQVFGAGPAFDAFVIAFKIPNFMRRLFGEGAFSQAFVPVMSEYREKKSQNELQAFINHIAGTLGMALLLVVTLAEILAPFIIMIFATGFIHDPMRYQLATHMLRITFPYLLFIALTAFAGAMLNTCGKFAIPAFTPVLLNLAMIVAAWFIAPYFHTPIYVLAWGVMAAGFVQLIFQLPFLKREGILPRPSISFRDPGVNRVLKLMVPALFGVSVAQLSLLIDNFFASFLPVGSISWLYYSDRLTYLPLGIVGVALATVVLPYLSRQHANQSLKAYSETLDWALRCLLLIGIPATVGLLVLAGPILVTLFAHGQKFNTYDVLMTRKSLMAYAVGLPSFMLVKVLASAFYSRQNIKTPVKIAALALGFNLIFNLILIFPFKHAGLALATSLASWINSSLLIYLLVKRSIYQPISRWRFMIGRILLANAIMALFLWWFAGDLSQWLAWGAWHRIWYLAVLIIVAMLLYSFALLLSGMRLKHIRPPK